MHGHNKGVSNLGQNVAFRMNIFNIFRLVFENSFGNDLHGQNLLVLSVAHLQDLSKRPHTNDLEEFKVLGGDVTTWFLAASPFFFYRNRSL